LTEGKINPVKCNVCGCELEKEDCIEGEGKIFCEDCFIESHHRIQACDPWAVRSKKIFREDLQKAIYEFIVSSGGAKKEEVAKKFGISLLETENQFALLRHCELVKGQKRADGVYLVPFES
jgi:hypothetical protein